MKKENASAFNSWRAFTNSEDSVGRIAQLKKKKEEKILACESSVSCDTSSITFPRFLNYTYDAFLSSSFFSLDSLFRFSLPVFHPLFVASVFAAPNPVSLTGGNSVPGSYKVIFMIVVYNFYFEQKSFDWMEGEKNVIKFARENWITTDHAVYLDPNWFPSTEMKSKRLETNQLSFFFFYFCFHPFFFFFSFASGSCQIQRSLDQVATTVAKIISVEMHFFFSQGMGCGLVPAITTNVNAYSGKMLPEIAKLLQQGLIVSYGIRGLITTWVS